ncbi:DUF3043 domain-containing protein [Galbitalea sp. SE-J8]|uniref:DUF3043 domain-containing protein n=1 Tax=Galbitalea sp. SE-J8 TaxID=3054952 RepID=UPI00259C8C40|nr:DUF3043 domain-containing protein [Galbitalea sp. SE-J8]MDM4763975.1 DUF3043 domain-containing protein [Galbitalea sp. SE-J8]
MAKQHETSDVDAEATTEAASGKGRATPSRREREAANRRPLVVSDRAEARRQSRATSAAERERARVGLAAGEEKYLPVRDRGPQKKFVRDWVDARWSVGELLIPVMVLVILLSFFDSAIQLYSIYVLYAFFVLAILDSVVLGFSLTRKLRAKYGDRVERVRWYAAMRSFQLRPMRLPKAQVKRGAYPSL